MTNTEFVNKAKAIAKLKTLYVNGCFGDRLTASNKIRYINATSYNQRPERKTLIMNATEDTWGFDCNGLIKACTWGFSASNKQYGGSIYQSNGLKDTGEAQMIAMSNPSTDFSKLELPGSIVYMPGHIGIYIGDGLVIESTPSWNDGVQITACLNIGNKPGYKGRKWTSWGKVPWIEYEDLEMVQKISVLCEGQKIEVDAINKDGTNYIRLRDFEEKLNIAKVSYDSAKRLPVIEKK